MISYFVARAASGTLYPPYYAFHPNEHQKLSSDLFWGSIYAAIGGAGIAVYSKSLSGRVCGSVLCVFSLVLIGLELSTLNRYGLPVVRKTG